MTAYTWILFVVFFGSLTALCVPLGAYMHRVYAGEARVAQKVLGPVERLFYRAAGVDPAQNMSAGRYIACLLVFNVLGMIACYLIQRFQAALPLNPARLGPVSRGVALNTAVSFATNTNWQAYAGETVMSHLTQMLALTVQNFLSAATGMAVAVALARGFAANASKTVGNFWADMARGTLYVLVPLSLVLGVFLVSGGVVQTWQARQEVALLEPVQDGAGHARHTQTLALGPAASQVAIKQLGTNGGGFFNANSAHPFENPTPLTNFAEMLAILLIPGAFCHVFGRQTGSRRHGWLLFGVMMLFIVPLFFLCAGAEQAGNPALAALGVDAASGPLAPGGNMEGKELRFGAGASALWATATTAASSGSVNAMHDSFTPLGGLVPLWLMQLGEVVFGGAGSGLYGILLFAVAAVFMAGLMVGRAPELLGKKLEAFEMKMAVIAILLPSACVLGGTAVACVTHAGTAPVLNPGPHGFSEILYAFSSGANNNGSAFAGLDASGLFYTLSIAFCMLAGRFGVIVPVLFMAGALGAKKSVPASVGTLATDTPLFAVLLAGTIILAGALTFIPALALGPVIEQLMLYP